MPFRKFAAALVAALALSFTVGAAPAKAAEPTAFVRPTAIFCWLVPGYCIGY